MDTDFKLSLPVIPSALSAEKLADEWTYNHDFRHLRDAAGFIWGVSLSRWQNRIEDDQKKILWCVKISLKSALKVEQLIQTNTLDPIADRRVISILGNEKVPFALRPYVFQSKESEEAVEQEVAQFLPRLQVKIAQTSLVEIKKQLIAHWVETKTSFKGCGEY